jgi:predicted acetyltransferase
VNPKDRLSTLVTRLLEPSQNYRTPFLSMAQDWRDHAYDRYRLALDDFDAYLANLENLHHLDRLPPGWVPSTEFWLEDDQDHIVACVRLRFQLTPALEIEGGHVGYDVRPSFRRRGFGTAALRLVLPEARQRGLLRVRITVDADNLPSIRIIERNGGLFSGETISPKSGKPIRQYWLDTLQQPDQASLADKSAAM